MQFQSLTGAWQFRQTGTEEWMPAQVPGGVHTDLLALSRIPDPFVGDNEKRVQWVAESDWEYRCSFTCSPELLAQEKIWLVCDGLDTLATVTLNDHQLGHAENMFRQYRWNVKPLLATPSAGGSSANELLIEFDSPVKYAAEKQAIRPLHGVSQAIPGGPYLRKAPCQFGWDWGPQLPPIGIWKDIRLEGYSGARFTEVHLRQQHTGGHVMIEARVDLERWTDAPLTVELRVTSPEGKLIEGSAPISPGGEASVRLEIPDPQLWWPNGYGRQPLYRVEVALREAGSPQAVPLDARTYQIGLRTLELRQEEDRWGHSFIFVINGVPIFAKGSDWIPADSFPTRITDEHLEWLIRSAAETHQNMLRVWGGGFYEEERFYDLCDRYGILVWQDFIFACSVYPLGDTGFLENLQHEVIQNVRRLRHRASLALWCGNNEMERDWASWGSTRPELQDLKDDYERFFYHTLPGWCASEDPDRAYWPSSPSSGVPFEDPDSQRQGDAHYWDVWHGRQPFTAYRGQYPRFMSEFGFQALPPMETIKIYAAPADWNMTSYIMEQHQKNESGNSLMVGQMLDTFRLPKDFESLVYLTQVLQAEGIRYGVEHWRRHMGRVCGTLYWQLNDCWPVASWSSLDYFGRWKALHYAARRFYAPVMLSVEDQPTAMGLYVSSDLTEPWEGIIRWSLETLGGEVLASGQQEVRAGPLAATHVRTLDFANRLSDQNQRELAFVAELWQGDRRLALQVATFVPTKHLSLGDPAITARLRGEEGTLIVEVACRSLARLVELSLQGADAVFSDNYFDLPAGRTVAVSCPRPPGWTSDQARAALKVRSVYDTFAGTDTTQDSASHGVVTGQVGNANR